LLFFFFFFFGFFWMSWETVSDRAFNTVVGRNGTL
jgi:hypothetical protein